MRYYAGEFPPTGGGLVGHYGRFRDLYGEVGFRDASEGSVADFRRSGGVAGDGTDAVAICKGRSIDSHCLVTEY